MVVTIAGAPLLALVLASVRLVAWLVVVPPFSSRAVPMTAKTLLAFGLALSVAPGLAAHTPPADAWAILGAALQEALVGATMGFVTFLVFAAVQAAGELVDLFGGFTLAAAFDPLSQNMNSVNGKLFSMLGTMLLFVMVDGWGLIVTSLVKSYGG